MPRGGAGKAATEFARCAASQQGALLSNCAGPVDYAAGKAADSNVILSAIMNSKKIERTSIDQDEPTVGPTVPPARTYMPHIVHPSAVYTVEDLRRLFGLKASSVRREVRLRRLRIAKRCGRYYCLGQWVLQWFGDGEVKPPAGRGDADRSNRNERSI